MVLPCKHREKLVEQVEPTIDLLSNMDDYHPEVLKEHGIQPIDYKSGLVFRSAIESIRGTFIASSMTGRQALVCDVLENLKQTKRITDYKQTSGSERLDFTVEVKRIPDYFAGLEVKGGEGNSINISERPIWAKEFCVWCHLDGAIRNQPSHGAHSIINRLTNELVRRGKLVDVLFFKDILCGTRARPCPKYGKRCSSIGLRAAPDIFLFPQRIPTLEDPEPPVHSLRTVRLPGRILDVFGVEKNEREEHIWKVHVKIIQKTENKIQRKVIVMHQGKVVGESLSRSWTIRT